jgi:predicted transcriptional regulator
MSPTSLIDRLSDVPYTAKQIAALLRFAKANLTSRGLAECMNLEFREAQNRVKMLVDKSMLEPVDKWKPNTKYRMTTAGETLLKKILKP